MRHRILMMLVMMATFVVAIAQETREIKGTVTDGTGEPLIGATVKPAGEGTAGGTITDLDGNFKLKVAKNVTQ